MAHSSCTKSSISIDLFNLPPLPDTRKQSPMICEIPNDFFLPDGKNTQLSKIVNVTLQMCYPFAGNLCTPVLGFGA